MDDAMTDDRHLDWDGCFNVRDLGGLPTADGRLTRRGAVVRGDKVSRLTAAGWEALVAHGVRTIVDLRDPSEYQPDAAPRPTHLTTIRLPLEDQANTEFWQQWRGFSCTPLYYRPFLEHASARIAAVFAAIAEAEPGGVLVHCGAGRDRSGLVTLVLLALLGVSPELIAADYLLSAERLRRLFALEGREDEDIGAQEQLQRANTSDRGVILATLAALEAAAYLRAGGVRPDQLAAIARRLLDDPDGARS
jgi:protein tyrosine/serine phosphatase